MYILDVLETGEKRLYRVERLASQDAALNQVESSDD